MSSSRKHQGLPRSIPGKNETRLVYFRAISCGLIRYLVEPRMKLLPILAVVSLSSALAAEEGFQPLFNGTNLAGWVPCNVAADTIAAKDGMIVTTGKPIGV